MTLPAISAPPTSAPPGSVGHDYAQRMPDATGQIAPPGTGKPKVAATLWEDEGTLCFQVESNGICVTRRHGKHDLSPTLLTVLTPMCRQPYDQRYQATKCGQDDERPTRWLVEEREATQGYEDRANASEGSLVSLLRDESGEPYADSDTGFHTIVLWILQTRRRLRNNFTHFSSTT